MDEVADRAVMDSAAIDGAVIDGRAGYGVVGGGIVDGEQPAAGFGGQPEQGGPARVVQTVPGGWCSAATTRWGRCGGAAS
ncbi:hypothetical protein ACL02T_05660 [Pseudonocardia sp. RS010]|uniref:hypothetical protein n=1 Tax=Pseudonocardia sp. RS010 TaxID=3385979 RepID=UPI0039A0A823